MDRKLFVLKLVILVLVVGVLVLGYLVYRGEVSKKEDTTPKEQLTTQDLSINSASGIAKQPIEPTIVKPTTKSNAQQVITQSKKCNYSDNEMVAVKFLMQPPGWFALSNLDMGPRAKDIVYGPEANGELCLKVQKKRVSIVLFAEKTLGSSGGLATAVVDPQAGRTYVVSARTTVIALYLLSPWLFNTNPVVAQNTLDVISKNVTIAAQAAIISRSPNYNYTEDEEFKSLHAQGLEDILKALGKK